MKYKAEEFKLRKPGNIKPPKAKKIKYPKYFRKVYRGIKRDMI